MGAGKYRHRAVIAQRVLRQNEDLDEEVVYLPIVPDLPCLVEYTSQSQETDNSVAATHTDIKVTCRFRATVKPEHYVQYRGENFQITGAVPADAAHIEMVIYATKSIR